MLGILLQYGRVGEDWDRLFKMVVMMEEGHLVFSLLLYGIGVMIKLNVGLYISVYV
jgi:hypothetical protein